MQKLILLIFFSLPIVAFTQTDTYHFPTSKGDTFYVNKVLFKICLQDKMSENAFIENLQNNKWNVIDSFDIQQYKRSVDVDKNGFPDIAVWHKMSYDVFLFDPGRNIFVHSGEFSTRDLDESIYYELSYTGKSFQQQKMQLINKELNLYYNYVPEKRGEFHSDLFQIQAYKKIVLGTIYQYASWDSKMNTYIPAEAEIKSSLRKPKTYPKIDGKNGISYQQVPETEELIESIDKTGAKGIDYENYWKLNWRKFLKNQ